MQVRLEPSVSRQAQQAVVLIRFCQCCLLINFANNLDPDQAQQNVGPDLDPNRELLTEFLKDLFFQNIYFEKISGQ